MDDSVSRRAPDRTWIYIGLAFLGFWVAYLFFFGPRNPEPLEESRIDQPAPYDWTLEDLDGQPVRFTRFKGKTVFLNIWATWCGPCIAEMPSISRLAADPRLKGKNIEFVCVSVDDSAETVRRFLSGQSWPMTVLRTRSFPPAFNTDGIPATFIIAPDGKIVKSQVGSSEWDTPEVVSLLEKTSADAPSS